MPNPLIQKLEHFTRLSGEEKERLEQASQRRIRRFSPRETVIAEGDVPHHVNLILSGWACRYKVLEDGRRQIVSYFVPGDLCDLKVFTLKHMDHSIGALSAVTLAEISRDTMMEFTDRHTRISRALWWSSMVAEAIEREWIVNLGQRNASERLGHLFCEMFYRLRVVGLTEGKSYHLPVTQSELAETTGLSSVHVNRSLQQLRTEGLISLSGKTVTIPDLARLEAAVMFNPNYLHLDHEGSEFSANDS